MPNSTNSPDPNSLTHLINPFLRATSLSFPSSSFLPCPSEFQLLLWISFGFLSLGSHPAFALVGTGKGPKAPPPSLVLYALFPVQLILQPIVPLLVPSFLGLFPNVPASAQVLLVLTARPGCPKLAAFRSFRLSLWFRAFLPSQKVPIQSRAWLGSS